MDQALLIKIIHMSCASAVFLILLARAFPLLMKNKNDESEHTSNKILIGLQHLGYSILVLSGLWLLWLKNFDVQPWFYAKLVLFFAILSCTAKAFKRNDQILLVQRKAGLIIAIVAFIALFGLIILKPQFG